ncbi:MAG: two-component sensor histidine kinase, partial [Daejeonella sp.]|nr:two-component sensor histidine kinase [Daejeonella sp.]
RCYVLLTIFTLSLIDHLFFEEFSISFLLFSVIISIFLWIYYKHRERFSLGLFIISVLFFAVISSSKLARFQFLKERESRKLLATKLESSVDPNAVLLFLNLEQEIIKDKFVVNYFSNPLINTSTYSNRLFKLYFTGYLSRFEFKTFEYNTEDNVLKGETETPLNTFKNQVISGSVKVSNYFYRSNNTFGSQNYFAILPIINSNKKLGTLVIQLSSKSFTESGSFPELLDDGRIIRDYNFNEYSYAYYNNGRLVNQQGKYVYDLINKDLKGKPNDFIFVIKADNKGNGYSHLIYHPNALKIIIISKEVPSLLSQLAAVSFIFLILLTFSSIVFGCIWIWRNFDSYNISFKHFKWHYLIKTNRMLYKTRIQVSMVSAVVITLVTSGIITFINISNQYRAQQEEGILAKVNKIATSFNKQLLRKGTLVNNAEAESIFNIFAELNGTDLNLFNLDGDLIHSTQPKIYENGITASKMNPLAYLYLNKLQKSEYINKETVGKLNFIAAYVPLKNNEGIPQAYIGLPYFSNEKDYQERIGIFLNALINVYALVFVAIGFFAVFVANKITDPLTIIEKSLSETKIGRKNEPINWKRNDEIGNLIKEYNNMIAALEESAQKLARSERESAWREMAKQVAHEIKNPLTPLKLGVQLLDKSWREKDPKFDIKFEKFSKSFIEQIESLAHIASEFSNFAKMPDTILEKTDIKKVVKKSIDLYTDTENLTIALIDETNEAIEVKADKDQLLRCFNNLIKNSIEAMPDNRPGFINITLKCISGFLHIAIEDNGSGISHGLIDRIFVPNFTTKSSGTGLGLAFVKQAIENMEGAISFDTEENKGTTFNITMPVAKG